MTVQHAQASETITVIIPVFNERQNLAALFERLDAALVEVKADKVQIVVVDDGSTDGTGDVLDARAAEDSRLSVIHLARNFGHQNAISAGFDYADSDYAVVMDGDLQDPPEAIPELVRRAREGYDVVYAQRMSRRENWFLRACYGAAYRVISALSDLPLPLDAGDFAVLSRRAVDHISKMREQHRYLRGMRAWIGLKQVGIPVDRGNRYAGTSKYSVWKLTQLALDGLFSFSVVPLRAAFVLGFLAIVSGTLYGCYLLFMRIVFGQIPQGFTTLMLALILFSGVQLFFLGVIGSYVGRIYQESKGRPLYIIERIVSSKTK